MKLANIIFEKELINHTKVDYINYYNESTQYENIETQYPTLYVGWSFMKKCNPDNFIIQNANILSKKIISKELYWECSFEESKKSHISGVESFVLNAPDFYFSSKFNYINLDPIFFQISNIDDLFDILPINIDKFYIYKNDMIYVLSSNNIWGINVETYSFFGFSFKEIKLKLEERSKLMVNDLEGDVYMKYFKIFPKYQHLKRYLVTMI